MKYNVIAKIPLNNDNRDKVIGMVESSGFSYLIDYDTGSTVLAVIESAEPKGLDLESLMTMITAYKKAFEANKGKIPAELRDTLKNMDVVDIVKSIQNIFLKASTAIEKLSIAVFCAQNGIPMGTENTSTCEMVSVSKEDYDIKNSLVRSMEGVIELILSDSEMKEIYGKMIEDAELKKLFNDGKINKLDIAAKSKDILTQKMMNLWSAADIEKNNLKLFCITLCSTTVFQDAIKDFLKKAGKSCNTEKEMAECISDWATVTSVSQMIGKHMNDISCRFVRDRRDTIKELGYYKPVKLLIKAFAESEGMTVPECQYSDLVIKIAEGDAYVRFISFMSDAIRRAARLLRDRNDNKTLGVWDAWDGADIE